MLHFKESEHKNSQKILQTRHGKDKSVLMYKDLKFDQSIKDNLKLNYQDTKKSI
jgi:hypothetical protein